MGFQPAFPIPLMYQMIIAVILNVCVWTILSDMEVTHQDLENKILSHTD